MADALSESMRERVEELCRRISVAHTLDAEIQEELRGHMEDKLLAYVNGEEPLTDDDAFLLVREHFGDPANLKAQLQDVHIVETGVSLARRLAAIIALYFVLLIAAGTVQSITLSVTTWLQIVAGNTELITGFSQMIHILALVIGTIIIWRVLVSWERRIQAGQRPWFYRSSGIRVIVGLAALMCFYSILPVTSVKFGGALVPFPEPMWFKVVAVVLLLGSLLLNDIIWLWWCDRPPRRPRTLTYAAFAWVLLSVIPLQTGKFVHLGISDSASLSPQMDAPGMVVLWQERVTDVSVMWTLRTGFITRDPDPLSFFLSLLLVTLVLLLAKFLYEILVGRRQVSNPAFPEAAA